MYVCNINIIETFTKFCLELFQDEEQGEDREAEDGNGDSGDYDDGGYDEEGDDSGTGTLSSVETSHTHLLRAEAFGSTRLPHVFQTNHLVFYERFKAYQDYILGNTFIHICQLTDKL